MLKIKITKKKKEKATNHQTTCFDALVVCNVFLVRPSVNIALIFFFYERGKNKFLDREGLV